MSIEAMKQWLEALERSVATCFDQYAHQQAMSQPDHFINQAITSLRKAIAEAEQDKPVSGVVIREDMPTLLMGNPIKPTDQRLYTHPQPRKPLTDEQISNLWCKTSNTDFVTAETHVFARAIEAAHGIKE